VFLLFYGLLYPLKGNLWEYLAQTGTIYLASMSVLLVACCYWKRANSWGATAAICAGAIVPLSYLALRDLPATHEFVSSIGPNYAGLIAYGATTLAMIAGSLLKPQRAEVR
jgi:SSS family solute:Na+ symporter